MALFFDAPWFDARLAERGLTRAGLAAGAALSDGEVALIFKDQRELSAREVTAFAELLGVSPAEVADHAGVSTPVPGADDLEARLGGIEARLAAIETTLARLAR